MGQRAGDRLLGGVDDGFSVCVASCVCVRVRAGFGPWVGGFDPPMLTGRGRKQRGARRKLA